MPNTILYPQTIGSQVCRVVYLRVSQVFVKGLVNSLVLQILLRAILRNFDDFTGRRKIKTVLLV